MNGGPGIDKSRMMVWFYFHFQFFRQSGPNSRVHFGSMESEFQVSAAHTMRARLFKRESEIPVDA